MAIELRTNEEAAQAVQRHPDTLVGMATIGLGRGGTRDHVYRFRDQGFKGLKFIVSSPTVRENRPRAMAATCLVVAAVAVLLFVVPFPSLTRVTTYARSRALEQRKLDELVD